LHVEQEERRKGKHLANGIGARAFKAADRVPDRMRGLKGIPNAGTLEHDPEEFDIIGTIIGREHGL